MELFKIITLLFAIALGSVQCYSVYQMNGQTHAIYGDIKIDINSSTFKCDHIECPKDDTIRCVIMKRNLPENPKIVRRENYCIGADNQILNKTIVDENVGDNRLISEQFVATRDGNIWSSSGNSYSFSSSSNLDPKARQEFTQSMNNFQERLKENLQNLRNRLANDMTALHNNLQRTFSGNFPFN